MTTNTSTSTNTVNGINQVSFSNTPQAKDDSFLFQGTEGQLENGGVIVLNVMANDLGGNAKTLYSVDDGGGTKSQIQVDLSSSDLTNPVEATDGYTQKGAALRIVNGKVEISTGAPDSPYRAAINALAQGEVFTDSFVYAIRLGNGTLSWARVTFTITGTNDAPVIGFQPGNDAGTVVEAGDFDNGTDFAGTATVSGVLTASDADAGATQNWSVVGGPSTYGNLALNGNTGQWTYTLDNTLAATQALAEGQSVTQSYTVRVTDQHGAYDDQTVTITITGSNDSPVITNAAAALAGTVIEAGDQDDGTDVAGTASVSGQLSATDVDTGATQTWTIQGTPSTTYGSIAINATTGEWTYTLDNTLAATQALAEGTSVTQSYTARVTDDKGAYVDQTVTITITGTNDSPVITNAAAALVGTVVEAGDLDDGTDAAGTSSVSGQLSATDVDAGATQTWTIEGTPSTTYGSLAISATGLWTYTLNNADADTQALAEGDSVTQSYTARVTDDKGAYVDQTVIITITGTNDSPVITNAAAALAGTVVEAGDLDDGTDVAGTTTVSGQLSATDVDLGATQTWSIQGTPSTTYGSLAVNATSGLWTYTLDNADADTQALAEGASVNETYTVRVTDDKGAYVDQTVTITITGTNDSPVITNAAAALAGTVVEAGDQDDGTDVSGTSSVSGQLSATDVDTGATQTWSIQGTPSTTYGSLAVNATSGLWTYTLDNADADTQALAEGDSVDETYTVRVTDDFGAYVDQTVTVTITGTNDSPVITNAAAAILGTVVEAGDLDDGTDAAGTSSVSGQLSATDVDAGATQTWSIQGTPSTTYGSLAVNATSGLWTYTLDNADADTQALAEGASVNETYTVRVTDDKGAYVDQTVTVTITGTNDSPVITNAAAALAGTVVEAGDEDDGTDVAGTVSVSGQLSATDVDAGATQTWTIEGTPSTTYGSLAISATGLWTYTLDNADADTQALAEGDSVTQSYTARVTDDKGAYVDQTVIITITGTNDSPVITNAAAALAGTVVEAGDLDDGTDVAGTTTVSGQLSATDVDAGATQTWSIQGTPSTTYGSLAVNATTGQWTYTLDNADVDTQALAEGDSVDETYTVRVTDDFGAYVDQTVTITITGTNDSPVITNAAAALAGTVIEAGDLDDGTDVAGTTTVSGQLSATDVDAGATQTWTIEGTPSTTYGSLAVNAATGQWTYTLDNVDTDTQALAEGDSVDETYTVRVTDDFGAYVDQTVTVTITGTNDSPVITNTAAALVGTVIEAGNSDDGTTVAGTASVSGQLSATDVDAGATQTWTIEGTPSTTYGSLAVNAATGQWTYTLDNADTDTQALAEGDSVDETYTVRVTDDFGAYVDQTVTITITGTNDSPVITNAAAALAGTVVEAGDLDDGTDVAGTTTVSGQLSATDVDAGATQTWTIEGTSSTTYGSLAVNAATGQWTYTLDNADTDTQALAEGDSVDETYTVRVTDDFGAYVDQTVTITITGTNDSPVVTNSAAALTGTVVEAGDQDDGTDVAGTASVSGQLSASDVDAGATQTWSIEGTPSTTYGSLAVNATTGQWTYTLDNADTDTQALAEGDSVDETYTVRVTDDFGAYVDQTVTVTITGTNDSPVITNTAAALVGTVIEAGNSDDGTTVAGTASVSGQLSASDVDAGATQTWTIEGTPSTTYGSLAVNATTGLWTYTLDNADVETQALTEGDSVDETYTVRVTDDFGAYVDQTVTITITGTNDSPVITNTAAALVGTVVEAGDLDDGTDVAGTSSVSGQLSASDVDAGATQTWTIKGTPSITYGSLAISATGLWTYTLDNADADTQALAEGASVNETYTVRVTDDKGAYVDQTVTITITGTNDSPVITNAAAALAGTVVEAGDQDDGTDVSGTSSVSGQLSATDVDTGATQTWSIQGTPSTTYGSLAVNATSGLWTYTLDNADADTQALAEGDSVDETYTVRVTDDFGAYVDQTVTVTITGTNDSPVITNAAAAIVGTVVEAGDLDDGTDAAGTSSVSGQLSATDVDAGATQTWSIQGTPSTTYGSLAVNATSGLWTYTLDNADADTQALAEGASVNETYTVRVTDDKGAYVDQTVTVTITGTNDSPVITNAAAALAGTVVEAGDEDDGTDVAGTVSVSGQLSATDVDAGATQTWTIEGTPSTTYGSLAISATGLWTYTLDNTLAATQALAEGDSVTQSYTARVTDDKGAYVDQTVIITITGTNDSPVITNAAAALVGTVVEAGDLDDGTDVAGTSSVSGQLSATDVDAGATQTWTIEGTPSTTYGSLAISATGLWTYTLDNSLATTQALAEGDSVTQSYTARVTDDKGAYVDQTVIITITGTNDSPVITNAAAALVGTVVEAGDLDDGTDVAGTSSVSGQLSATDVDAGATQTWTIEGTPSTTYGSLAVNATTGQWTYTLDNADADTQALAEGDSVDETYTVRVTDDKGAYVDQTVTITITGTNDAPVAVADVNSGNEDTTITGTVATNDSDVDDGATLSYSLNAPVAGLTLDADGSYSFNAGNAAYQHLAAGATTDVVANYTVTDEHGATSTSTLTTTLTGTNDAPVAVADANSGNEDTTITGTVATNDSDVDDGATLSYSLNAPVAGLTLSANGSYSFNAGNAAYQHLAAGATTDVVANYTVTDEHGATSTSTLTITLTGTNDAPVLSAVGGLTYNDTAADDTFSAATGTLASSDIDTGDTRTFGISDGTSGGSMVVGGVTYDVSRAGSYGTLYLNSSTGQYRFNPNDSAIEALRTATSENFTFSVTDGAGASSTATLAVTLNGVNDTPATSGVTLAAIAEDSGPRLITQAELLANASDRDHTLAQLSATNLAVATGLGSLVSNGDGTWTYTPAANDDTAVSFSYTVTDGTASASGTATMDVTPVNDAATDLVFTFTGAPGNSLPTGNFGQMSVADPDGGPGAYSYSLFSLNATTLSGGPATGFTGDLTVSTGGVISASGLDENRIYELVIRVTQNGATFDESFNVITGTNSSPGNDTLDGAWASGDDVIIARGGGDTILAGSGNDTVFGQTDADHLYGGAGNDYLTGGGGSDHFHFDTALNATSNVDRVTDFDSSGGNQDFIQLYTSVFAGITASGGSLTTNQFASIPANGSYTSTTAKIVYDTVTGNLYYDANGSVNGLTGATLFATLDGAPSGLDASDFKVTIS